MEVDAASALRARGNELYKSKAYADAAEAYGAAADAARALFTASGSSAAGRELCLALSNRAACMLALGQPLAVLDDTWAVLTTLTAPGSREWQRRRRTDWGDSLFSTYEKALLRRAAAYEAATGSGIAALPSLAWLSARTAADATVHAAAARAASHAAAGPACLRCTWAPLRTRRRDAPPLPRRHPAAVALGGCVYLFGGDASNEGAFDAACGDLWCLPLPAAGDANVRWTKLASPKAQGGPPASKHAAAVASDATGELIVVDSRHDAFAYEPKAATWRRLGSVVPSAVTAGTGGDVERSLPPMLATSEDTLFALSCDSADGWTLVSLPLRGAGTAQCVMLPCGGAAAPTARRRAHMWWHPGSGESNDAPHLLVYGGVEDAPNGVPGHPVYSDGGGELGEMWAIHSPRSQAPRWERVACDGGGAPPVPRSESALVPLGAGAALLFGGFAMTLPAWLPVRTGAPPWPRFLADAHVFTPGTGWRPVCAESSSAHAPRPHPAAAAVLAFDAASRRLFVGGGFNMHPPPDPGDGLLPLNVGLFELHCDALAPSAAGAAVQVEEAAAAAWEALRCGTQIPVNSPRTALGAADRERLLFLASRMGGNRALREPSAQRFDELLAAALALRRPPPEHPLATVQWSVSWSCWWTNPAEPHAEIYQLLVTGLDWVSNQHRGRVPVPDRYDGFLGPAEPRAADVAWALLEAMTNPRGLGLPACKPDQVRFTGRTAHLLDELMPLLHALDIKVLVEPWAEAAISSLRSMVCPYGDNQTNKDAGAPHRCQCCRALKPKLRMCSKCKRTRYCDAECAAAHWEAHRQACNVLALKAQKGKPEPTRHVPYNFRYGRAEPGDTSQQDGSYRGVYV